MEPRDYIRLWELLRQTAKEGKTITYGEVVEKLQLPIPPIALGGPLDKISGASFSLVKCMASVVVVNKETQRPAEAFFEFARKLNPEYQSLLSDDIFEMEYNKTIENFGF